MFQFLYRLVIRSVSKQMHLEHLQRINTQSPFTSAVIRCYYITSKNCTTLIPARRHHHSFWNQQGCVNIYSHGGATVQMYHRLGVHISLCYCNVYLLYKYIVNNKKIKYIVDPPNELQQSCFVSMQFLKVIDVHPFKKYLGRLMYNAVVNPVIYLCTILLFFSLTFNRK